MSRYTAPRLSLLAQLCTGLAASAALFASAPAQSQDLTAALTPVKVAYYPNWVADSFLPSKTDPKTYTHLNYAFLDICWDGKHGNTNALALADCKDGDGKIIKPANGSIVLGDPAVDGPNGGKGKNALASALALKKINPNLKLMASVGGWTWSNRFSDTAATAATRIAFAKSAVEFLRKYQFDGIDIDWEYPQNPGIECEKGHPTCVRPADKKNFITLVTALRNTLNTAGKADGKTYLITVAAGVDSSYVEDSSNNNSTAWLKTLVGKLDFINLMTYDMHGTWDKKSGHVAPLAADPANNDGLTVTAAVDRFVKTVGLPANKVVMGVPFYGYGWAGCPAGKSNGQYSTCTGPATTGSDGGTFDFAFLTEKGFLKKDASGKYTVGGNGFTRYYNTVSQVPYLYNAATKVWIAYDDEQSVAAKAAFAKARGLRGTMFWELNADRNGVLQKALPIQ